MTDEGYKGAYFLIKPPEDFVLIEQDEYYDFAAFQSPDGKVEFAVYSPLWTGDAVEIMPNEDVESSTEEEVQESIVAESEIGPNATRTDTYITTVAHDFSFWRSIVDITLEKDGSKTQRVFSIKYADKEAYDEYLNEYLAFKESLIQYAD